MGVARLAFGRLWDPLGQLLGVTWLAFGRSGAALGLSWPLLGELLGTSWAFLAVSWLVWGASWVHFGSQTRLGRRFCQVLGWAGLGFGTLRGHVLPCLLLHLTLRYAMLLLLQSPRFCIYLRLSSFPSGAAVCAQHVEFSHLDPPSNGVVAVFDSLGASRWLIFRSLVSPGLSWALCWLLLPSQSVFFLIFSDFRSPRNLSELQKSMKNHWFS